MAEIVGVEDDAAGDDTSLMAMKVSVRLTSSTRGASAALDF